MKRLTNESYDNLIKNVYHTLRSSEKKVADYVLSNGYEIAPLSLAKLAHEVGVSEPTVMRFVKSIGCTGYSDFKLKVARDWGRENPAKEASSKRNLMMDVRIDSDEKIENIPEKMVGLTVKALQDTLKLIDIDSFSKVIHMIGSADIIDVYGDGNSRSIAIDMVNKLLRIGLNCRSYSDNYLQRICANQLKSKDLAIGISHSGSTRDTVDALRIAKESGAKTIALTNFRASVITEYADVVFYTGDVEATFYSENMFSRITQLAIVDMIYMGILLQNYDQYTQRLDKVNMLVTDRYYE